MGRDVHSQLLGGVIQVVETYGPDNYKGNCLPANYLDTEGTS